MGVGLKDGGFEGGEKAGPSLGLDPGIKENKTHELETKGTSAAPPSHSHTNTSIGIPRPD